jgi:hypothetical protein
MMRDQVEINQNMDLIRHISTLCHTNQVLHVTHNNTTSAHTYYSCLPHILFLSPLRKHSIINLKYIASTQPQKFHAFTMLEITHMDCEKEWNMLHQKTTIDLNINVKGVQVCYSRHFVSNKSDDLSKFTKKTILCQYTVFVTYVRDLWTLLQFKEECSRYPRSDWYMSRVGEEVNWLIRLKTMSPRHTQHPISCSTSSFSPIFIALCNHILNRAFDLAVPPLATTLRKMVTLSIQMGNIHSGPSLSEDVNIQIQCPSS